MRELYAADVIADDAEPGDEPDDGAGRYFVMLPDHTLKPATLFEWSDWFGNFENRRVAYDELDGRGYVSTICLGVDHNFCDGPPMLFETMARMGAHLAEDVMRRYSTYDEAAAGHAELLAEHRAAIAAVDRLTRKPPDADRD
ncbi:hypothetical protein P0D88_34840 [Paraburkholderia sp. RL18-103-BIB-C]|uniref:hypothetical protein n=1 Tax=Paraburkholderia sp. RL18-103-BIB-C TaxID=3031637 RepID=UPI0038B8CE47